MKSSGIKILFYVFLLCLCFPSLSSAQDLYPIPDDLVTYYEKAKFEKFNSYASENGLGGTKIYLEGKYTEVKTLYTDYGGVFYTVFTTNDGHEWLVNIDSAITSSIVTYNNLINHSIVIAGAYQGFSNVWKMPSMSVGRVFDRTTGQLFTTIFRTQEGPDVPVVQEPEKTSFGTYPLTFGGITFEVPEYFDTELPGGDDTYRSLYPETEGTFASLVFQIQQFNISDEEFVKRIPSIIQSTSELFLNSDPNAKIISNANASLAGLNAYQIDIELKDGKSTVYGCYSQKLGYAVLVNITVDDKDSSGLDYFSNFEKMISEAQLADSLQTDDRLGTESLYEFEFWGFTFDIPEYFDSTLDVSTEKHITLYPSNGVNGVTFDVEVQSGDISEKTYQYMIPSYIRNEKKFQENAYPDAIYTDLGEISLLNLPGYSYILEHDNIKSFVNCIYSEKLGEEITFSINEYAGDPTGTDYARVFDMITSSMRFSEEPDQIIESETYEILFNGIKFEIPLYYDMLDEESTESDMLFYPADESYGTMVSFQYYDSKMTDEEFILSIPETVDNMKNYLIEEDNEISFTYNGETVICGFPGYLFSYVSDFQTVYVATFFSEKEQAEYDVMLASYTWDETKNDYQSVFNNVMKSAKINSEDVSEESSPHTKFMNVMDEYKTFFDDYALFMNKFSNAENQSSLVNDYVEKSTSMLTKLDELEAISTENLEPEELSYYEETITYITSVIVGIN